MSNRALVREFLPVVIIAAFFTFVLLFAAGQDWAAWPMLVGISALGFVLFPVLIRASSKPGPHRPASISSLAVYLGWLAFVVIGSAVEGVPDDANDPSCDAFCLSTTAGWIVRIVLGAWFSTVFAIVVYLIVGFIAANRRTQTTMR